MQTRFILINTSHAGNVGAAARAMKTMGFDDLVLVAPRWANVLRREETIQRASGALDVLDKCRIVGHAGRSAGRHEPPVRHRDDPARLRPAHALRPREHFGLLSKNELPAQHPAQGLQARFAAGPPQGKLAPLGGSDPRSGGAWGLHSGVAFLFGSERFGMRNEDVYRCHVCLSIPSNPKFGSLNIGAALAGHCVRVAAGAGRLCGGSGHATEPAWPTRPRSAAC